ncbi:MAG: hypothetical protein HYU66_23625 [Armatimonadetes bacterium]|nr:hypothetical protein [Armatimonadota bacterium]
MRALRLLLLVCVAALPLHAQDLIVRTGDGLGLRVSPAGLVTAATLGNAALPLKGAGGFAVADLQNQPEPVNLVANPGFEDGPAGWALNATQSLDDTVAHGGKASARIRVGPEQGSSSLGCEVPVKPGTKYRCELWLRRDGAGVCGAYLSERGEGGKLTGTVTQLGRTVPTQDGVWHKLVWELTTQPATTRLNLRGDVYRSTGTIWLDDFEIQEIGEPVYLPLAGRAEARNGVVQLHGAAAAAGIELEATIAGGKEALRIDGTLRDTTGRDRAVGLRFALPLDALGWTWWDELEEHRTIEPAGAYDFTYECESARGTCSIYPWSALDGPAGGLTLALPLSQGPRVFVIDHDQRAPRTALTFYFGLSSAAERNSARAPFSFVLYRHDPVWGMRSAMERYYRLFAESFVKRPPFEGFLNYADLERFDARTHQLVAYQRGRFDDYSDFGEGYRFLTHVHGCYDFRMVPYDQPTRPPDDLVRQLLGEMVQKEQGRGNGYVPTEETLKKLTYDADGHIRYIGDTRYWRPQEGYNHTDLPGWGLNFRVNEDPGVSSYLADDGRRRMEAYAKEGDHAPYEACVTADAIEGYMANTDGLDYRREHFRTTTFPLAFGKESLKPAIANTIWDFHHQVWWPLTGQHKVAVYGNANCYEQIFALPFVDVPMTEFDWDAQHPGRIDRYLRASVYQKIWRHWRVWGAGEKDEASVRQHFAQGLASAVYPCVGSIDANGGDLEAYRDLFRQYVPAIEELSLAGWEPVPHARATNGVVAERYGSFASGELHFTLRSYAADETRSKVTLDRAGLGIPAAAALVAVDIVPGSPVGVEPLGLDWQVALPPRGARAFWVGTREQLAQHGFRLAERVVGKIARLFATECGAAGPSLAKLTNLTQRGQRASGDPALALADEIQNDFDMMPKCIPTPSFVDLQKLLYRARAGLAWVAVAVLRAQPEGVRVVEDGIRGESVQAGFGLTGAGDLTVAVRSPWPELQGTATVAGGRVTASLPVPAEPPRRLLPYLVEVNGTRRGTPFRVAWPVDVKVADGVTAAAVAGRAFRGAASQVGVHVTNHLSRAGEAKLILAPPVKAVVEPRELALAIPAKSAADVAVTVRLEANERLGELFLPYELTSADPAARGKGRLALLVGDPVPRVTLRRAAPAPAIDGDLSDAAWQGEPTILELRLLQGGKPATEKTAAWLAYDEQGLYVAFRCAESQMGKLQATLTERGAPLYREDDVELFLQVPGAARVLQFAVSPRGTISDNFGNDAPWRAAATQGADGWTVELFIPVSVLGRQPGGVPWAAQLGRQQKPRGEVSSWTPAQAFSQREAFGVLAFAEPG